MKITKVQIAGELPHPEIFLRHYGRLYSITALATSTDEANEHMAANRDEGCLAEHAGFVFVAKLADEGTNARPLSDVARELVRSLRNSTPGEIADAARMLDDMYTDQSTNAGQRRIARELSTVIHKFRK